MAVLEKMHKYEAYKDSGVDWIGEVPRHWPISRLGSYFFERREKVSDKDYKALSVTKNGILPQLENAAKTKDGDNRKLVKKGDFVINSRSDRKGSSGVSYLDGSVSLINIVLESKNIIPLFSEFLLKSNSFIEEYYRVGRGIVADLWTTRFDEMRTIMLAIPSYQEQTLIATYLDQKTTQINQAIAIKEKQIVLLKERKQIIIQNAVTKGLDPNVKMKDSGVDWIGEIPEHWGVKKIRYIFEFSKGLNITKENLEDNGVPCINYGEIHSKYPFEVNPDINILKCVSNKYLQNNSKSLLNDGDFIFADTSEDLEGSGNFTYLNSSVNTFAGYHTIICRKKINIDSRFLAYFFDSSSCRMQIRKRVKGVKVFSITQSILKDTYIIIPKHNEQIAIVNILDKISTDFYSASDMINRQIQKLKEYKTTLINSAVTGKIKITPEMINSTQEVSHEAL